jgi:DNA-binding transcriptional LysR family regulator
MLDSKIITFLDLCKTKSFTQTADNLYITQPAVSQHIKHLEDIYGAKLVYYKARKVNITKQGKLLEKFATSTYINNKKLKNIIKSSILSPRELVFATTRVISEFILPAVLVKYLDKYKYEKIKMVVVESKEAFNMLNLGEVDFIITDGNFRVSDYKSAHLFREETIAICSPYHQFAKSPVNFSDLIKERLIYRLDTSEVYNNLEMILSEKGYSIGDFKKTMVIGSIASIKELVKHNAGITFLYRFAVEKELQEKSLAKINVRNFNIYRDIYFVWLKESFFDNESLVLLDYCRQYIANYLDFTQTEQL